MGDLLATAGGGGAAGAAGGSVGDLLGAQSGGVLLNELSAAGADWVEIFNSGAESVDMSGWGLSDKADDPFKFRFPDRAWLQSGWYVVVRLDGAPAGRGELQADFSLRKDGEYVGLVRSSGEVVSSVEYPPQLEGLTYGYPAEGGGMTYLSAPTPGNRNSPARGPTTVLRELSSKGVRAVPGQSLPVCVHVYGGGQVQLGFRRGAALGGFIDGDVPAERARSRVLDMAEPTAEQLEALGRNHPWLPTAEDLEKLAQDGGRVECAYIPGDEVRRGEMLIWYAVAREGSGPQTRLPQVDSTDVPRYRGTIVGAEAESRTGLPVLHLRVHPDKLGTLEGGPTPLRGSVWWKDELFHNVALRKRGQTTMVWPKPKIKVDFKGKVFEPNQEIGKVEEFNLQAHYEELGDETYMRPNVASRVFQEAGVVAPRIFHLELHINGQFYGLYSFSEQVDDLFLKKHDLSPAGPLYKAWHGYLSNLRYDVEVPRMQWAYKKNNLKDVEVGSRQPGSYDDLRAFTLGINGRGRQAPANSREKYLFEHVNLPQVVNEMAVQALVLNQDRCTKNFIMYNDPETDTWARLPWDFESTFGISHDLGNSPSDAYCILACEQFNSPLYCDSEHSQDLREWVPQGKRRRDLRFAYLRTPSRDRYEPWVCENPGADGTGCFEEKTSIQAEGNFNYLTDAILDVPRTRRMYLRRLRTLMDEFLDGKLGGIFREIYAEIRPAANKDDAKWRRGKIDLGLTQIVEEQLPRRRAQLLSDPLIPPSQSPTPNVRFGNVEQPAAEGDEGWFVELRNMDPAEDFDLSGWKVSGDASFTLQPGTVLLAGSSLYLTPNRLAFRQRTVPPRAAEGLFVDGNMKGSLPVAGEGSEWKLELYNPSGGLVDAAPGLVTRSDGGGR